MPFLAFFLAIAQIAPLPIPLPPLEVGGEIVGPYLFREDVGQTTKVVLQNGLTVIVREQNAVPLVSVTTLVKAGYFDEPDSLAGVSQVVEHMLYKGTATRGVGQIARETGRLGGMLDAYTAYDRTVYQVVVPAANAVSAMEIQADALWNPAFDSQELQREIEVVVEENNRRLDTPRVVTEERLYATAFARHRMGRGRIGAPEGLRALSRADLVGYHQRYYQPSNTILVVVGRFGREAMLAQIVALYGGVEDVPVERDRGPEEEAQPGLRYGWERADVEQAQAAMGFHVPGANSPEADVLEVLSSILTGGRAARFNRILRDEEAVLVDTSSAYLGFPSMGFFRIHLEGPTPVDAERSVMEQLERIRRFGVTNEELARAKLMIARDYYGHLETVEGVGEQIALAEAQGDWRRLADFLPRILEVSGRAVQETVTRYFDAQNMSLFEYASPTVPLSLTEERVRTQVMGRVPANLVQRSVEPLPVAGAVPLLEEDGLITDLVGDVEALSILRGPDVYVASDRRLPLVSFGIFFPGGRLSEVEANSGITALMLGSALRGTLEFGPDSIARRLENAGARIEVVNEPDFFGYVLDGVTGSVRQALPVLMEIVQEPLFSEETVLEERQLQLARVRQSRDDALAYAVQLFLSTLFEDHPYGRSALGTEVSVNRLTRDDVAAWHREQVRGVMPTIVVVGDTIGSSLVYPITEALTNDDLVERVLQDMERPEVAVGGEASEEMARTQSVLIYGSSGPAFSDPDRIPMTVLRHVMTGLGGRLLDSIREQAGLADAVETLDDFRAISGATFTATAFSPAKEDQVRALVAEAVRELVEEGVAEDELELARNAAIGEHEVRLQSRLARTLAFARALTAGSGIDAVTGFGDAVRVVDKDSVDAVAREYMTGSPTIAVVRGRE